MSSYRIILTRFLQALPGLLLVLKLHAQSDTAINLPEFKTFPQTIADFTIDNLGNLFLVDERQQVKKLNDKFDSVAVYNDVRRYGQLSYIDAGNPLKVLLFYKDFNTVVVLDRFLNTRTTIDLRQSNILQASTIAQSYDNNLWVFDELDYKVKKLDDNGRILLESPDFRITFDDPPHPGKLEDYNKFLYAYDSSKGLLVMDYFGAYRNLVAYKGWQNVHGISRGIVATDATGLVYYVPGNPEVQHQRLPATILQAKKIRIFNNRLYALLAGGILRIWQLPV